MIVNTLNFNESAPRTEELLNNARNLSNFALNNNKAFDFGIDFLNDYFTEIAKYSYADFRQIEMVGLQMFAMLLNFGGLDDILAFYTLDLSPSGSGKSHNHSLQRQLILSPMIDILNEKEKAQGNLKKDEDKLTRAVFKGYHNGSNTSPQFFLRCAYYTEAQMLYFDEFGRALDESSVKPIINFCIENWSNEELIAPSQHQNYLHGLSQSFNCKIFCAMNSTLTYLGAKRYIHELQGGLLNRPLTYYAETILKNKNEVLEIDEEAKNRIIRQSQELMFFANRNANHHLLKNQINSHKTTKDFMEHIESLKQSYKDIYHDFFVRFFYNFKAILIELHYLKEFDFYLKFKNHHPSDRIEDSTFQAAFYFLSNYISNFETIVKRLEGSGENTKDPRIVKSLFKILDFENHGKLPISFGSFNSYVRIKPKPSVAELRELLKHFVNTDYEGRIIGLSEAGYSEIQSQIKDDERSPSELFKGI